MIINGLSLIDASPILHMKTDKVRFQGFSHGLTECGYDIRTAESVWMFPGRSFVLSSAREYFTMPADLMGRILNKSSWARKGLDASMTTNIEPGWRGYLTLELRYSGWKPLLIPEGVGIAQVIFEKIQNPVTYSGLYQDQEAGPQKSRT
jgi:dCTP deaminase